MKHRADDTIAAIATPLGQGAISVVRVSGPEAVAIADRLFCGKNRLVSVPGFTVHHGFILNAGGRRVDEVLATVFRRPHSYTGEDAVEFSCHGGIYVTHCVLEAVLDRGARMADPGEFTKRAFLNGRIDLSQAEAVADLITARSSRAHRSSMEQLEGKLRAQVVELRSRLMDLCSLLEIEIDFSEEGIALISREDVATRVHRIRNLLDLMISSFESGRVYREGVCVAIVGKPNAGKSSLFNSLLQEDRAIVTPIPGTTRDSLEESLLIEGLLFRLLDTAGLRQAADIVESEGVARSRSVMKGADVVVLVVDSTESLDRTDAMGSLEGLESQQGLIIAFNKIDLLEGVCAGAFDAQTDQT